MILFKTTIDLTQYLDRMRQQGKTIGFVPTMGALHTGHLSLIGNCKQSAAITVCSIFVNPTQFNDPQDFARYPVTLEDDLLLLEKTGCDIVFLPSVNEIYPDGTSLRSEFNIGYLGNILEGKYRPGHFQGVCQVMNRLLEIVMPATLFLGQKDYQQCMVIKKLVSLNNWGIRISIVATVRENSGLALSSRNRRLSEKDKNSATAIYQSLQYLKQHLQPGETHTYITEAESMINKAGFEKIDYVSIADADTLEAISNWNGQTRVVALVAAFISSVRLIDNMALN